MKDNLTKLCRQISIGSMFFVSVLAMGAKTVKVQNPLIDYTNTDHLVIDTVELTPDSTSVTLHTYSYLRNNITLQPSVKLVHDGKSYPLRSANGIELGKRMDIQALGDSIFTLSFEPLPIKTKSFDFIEGDGNTDYRLEGVHTDKTFDSQTSIELLNELPAQKWEKGIAVLKGKILNYKPDGDKTSVKVTPRSSLGRMVDKSIGVASVNTEGSFEVELPLYQSYQPCFFEAPGFFSLIYLSPNKESEVTINQAHRWSNGHNGKDGSVVFTGANEEINNQIALNIGHDMVWDSFFNNLSRNKQYKSVSEFKADVMRHKANCKDKIRRLSLTPTVKQLMNIQVNNDMLCTLLDVHTLLHFDDIDSTYYDFYREIDVDDPELMWASDFDSFIMEAYNPFADNLPTSIDNIPPDYYSYLIENNIVTGEDADLARSLISNNLYCVPKEIVDEYAKVISGRVLHYCDSLNIQGKEIANAKKLMTCLNNGEFSKFLDVSSHYLSWIQSLDEEGYHLSLQDAVNIPFENDIVTGISSFLNDNNSIISAFNEKYENYYEDWEFEKIIDKAIENFNRHNGKDSSQMNQLLAAYTYMSYIEQHNTLSEIKIANCRKRVNDIIYDFIMAQNNEMAKVLERAKLNVLEIDAINSGEAVLKEIAAKYKGKVIYIDIWGTWCSPCLQAISALESAKKNYSDNVKFVYLADETSPENVWDEKIKSIDGEHMRLSQTQMQEIMSKYALSAYPSYIVIGKDGSIAYSGSLHELEDIKKLLNED